MKPLSELIESAEPEFIDYDENCTSVCDRESYDKMKAIAIEMAKACERYDSMINAVQLWPITRDDSVSGIAVEALSRARSLLEGEK